MLMIKVVVSVFVFLINPVMKECTTCLIGLQTRSFEEDDHHDVTLWVSEVWGETDASKPHISSDDPH